MSMGISTDVGASSRHLRAEDACLAEADHGALSGRSPIASQLFLAERHSVQALGRFVVSALEERNLLCVARVALLLTSELALDALLHARTGFRVLILFGEESLRVEVYGGNTRLPSSIAGGVDAINARSLKVLRAFTSSWGAEDRLDGRVVWFELPVTTRLR